jgi:hypothetical protein
VRRLITPVKDGDAFKAHLNGNLLFRRSRIAAERESGEHEPAEKRSRTAQHGERDYREVRRREGGYTPISVIAPANGAQKLNDRIF